MTQPKTPKVRKQLYLSQNSIDRGTELQSAMCRNSFSNVVEALIDGEHKRQFPASKVSHVEQPQTEAKAA